MPTYQYACTECQDQFEVVQAFTDDSLTECPHCGGRLRKVYSAVGVVFKGSGFYRTDSRSESRASGGSGASASGEGSSAAASDGAASKPDGSAPKPDAAKPGGSGGSGSGDGGAAKPAPAPAAKPAAGPAT